MCGIAGIIYKNNNFDETIKQREIKILTDAIAHRGPDGEGFYFENNFALGHRRLAIIDLSEAGHQPMEYKGKKGEYVIVYNGEIYNYIEIKEELKKEGYIFNSHTDTEVILASYDRWDFDCLNKFNGMWAFVIYDKKKNILFGSRDRFGVKPFYFINNDNVFAFASEIKALLKLKYYSPDINEDVLFDYLVFGLEEQEKSIFKNIYELFPSYSFVFNLNDLYYKDWKYYELKYNDKYERFDEKKAKEYISNVKDLIYKAVRLRLRSDVQVGSCLSGGLDSSSIVCVINDIIKSENLPQVGFKQNAFTAVYEDKTVDESDYAKIVVDHTNTLWHKTWPTDESLLSDLEDLIYYQEIPFGSTSIYAQYKVMQLTKQNNVKVLLDGQGGDELFTGYSDYYLNFYEEMIRENDFKGILNEFKSLNNSPINSSYLIKLFLKKIIKNSFQDGILSSLYFITQKRIRYFNKNFIRENKKQFKYYKNILAKSLNEQLYFYMKGVKLKTLLKYEDRNSMRFSIESRTPFSDDINLIEYVFNIPSSYKIHNGWSKYLLRESMKGVLPEKIRLRKSKIGFETPEKKWIKKNKEFFINIINENRKFLENYLDFDNLIKDTLNEKIFEEGFLFWRIINLALWEKIFLKN